MGNPQVERNKRYQKGLREKVEAWKADVKFLMDYFQAQKEGGVIFNNATPEQLSHFKEIVAKLNEVV